MLAMKAAVAVEEMERMLTRRFAVMVWRNELEVRI